MRTDKMLWRNRRLKKELARRLQSENPGLEVVHPRAAGIDVGNGAHYAAVRPDRDSQPVRRFECFTADLYRLADWLQSCGVQTVALQSTGVYWIPLYDILEERGFEVYLVNARHTKNLPGRKSDVQESQWLLKLHTSGLLNNSFQPPSKIRILRTYWRQRLQHVTGAATCVQRMQKALTQMNIQLANVISDLSGVTGQLIVRAIRNLGRIVLTNAARVKQPETICPTLATIGLESETFTPPSAEFLRTSPAELKPSLSGNEFHAVQKSAHRSGGNLKNLDGCSHNQIHFESPLGL